MRDLDIPLLRSFVAVSRAGSISAAAARISRTQSAISMQMQKLSAITGQQILHRTANGVELTAAGERLLSHAEQILGEVDETLADMLGQGLRGSISFGCPEDYLTAFFPDLLKGFGAEHGNVEIEVVCAPTIDLQALLQRRRLDAALISLPENSEIQRIIRPERFVWVANSPAPEILGNRLLPLALSAPGTLDHHAARTALDAAGRRYRVAFASNSLAGLLAVTRSGQAVSVITQSAVPEDLHVLPDALPPLPGLGIALAYATSRPPPIAVAFGEFVTNNLRQ